MEVISETPLRILDIDLENRPLNYLAQDWTGAEITAFAWAWVGEEGSPDCLLLTKAGRYFDVRTGKTYSPRKAFTRVRDLLESAGMVTGHYIRRHDLPMLNAHCMEHGAPPLSRMLTQDTKMDLVRRKDLSASQENLAAMLGLAEPKHHMSQTEWRTANRLGAEGLTRSYERVTKDVIQHMALRAELVRRKLLHPPIHWSP